MKLEEFYKSKVDEKTIKLLDINYKKILNQLIESVNEGKWTKLQKKTQIGSILPKIALYKTFVELGISKDESKELVRHSSHYIANKAHIILKTLFKIPKFQKVFRMVMRKGMKEDEIWHSNILKDDDKNFAMDVTKCLWKDTCDYFGCPEICEVFCSNDNVVFGNNDKIEFQRTKTLGTEGEKCDFKFIFK